MRKIKNIFKRKEEKKEAERIETFLNDYWKNVLGANCTCTCEMKDGKITGKLKFGA